MYPATTPLPSSIMCLPPPSIRAEPSWPQVTTSATFSTGQLPDSHHGQISASPQDPSSPSITRTWLSPAISNQRIPPWLPSITALGRWLLLLLRALLRACDPHPIPSARSPRCCRGLRSPGRSRALL